MDLLSLSQLAGVLSLLLPLVREVLQILVLLLPRSLIELLLAQLIYLPLALAPAFLLGIQYERKGWWRVLFPVYAFAGLLSAYLNYTTLALLLWDLPRKGENTFSQRCERLVFDEGWRGAVARLVAAFTNRFDPTSPHIPLP